MARKKEEGKILDVSAAMQGSLIFSDPVNLRISGRFEGNLKTKGSLIIGEGAEVFAGIEGEDISISGYVKGNIKSTERVSITSTGNVEGDIVATRLAIEEGALFNGRCVMGGEKLTLSELSEYLDIEEKKIMEWVQDGSIPAGKENSQLVFDRKAVEGWISKVR